MLIKRCYTYDCCALTTWIIFPLAKLSIKILLKENIQWRKKHFIFKLYHEPNLFTCTPSLSPPHNACPFMDHTYTTNNFQLLFFNQKTSYLLVSFIIIHGYLISIHKSNTYDSVFINCWTFISQKTQWSTRFTIFGLRLSFPRINFYLLQ